MILKLLPCQQRRHQFVACFHFTWTLVAGDSVEVLTPWAPGPTPPLETLGLQGARALLHHSQCWRLHPCGSKNRLSFILFLS